MAKEWQIILDNFSSGNSSTSHSASSQASSTQPTSSNNWQGILDSFSGSRKKKYDDAIAPVASRVITSARKKKEEEEDKGWFKKGATKDGITVGSISKAILGTGADILEDLTAGIIGMGEKTVDAIAQIAPYAANAQLHMDGPVSPEVEKAYKDLQDDAKKELGSFVAKDLYDENAVARQILSGVGSGAYVNSKVQNGGYMTSEDIDYAQKLNEPVLDYLENDMELDSVLGKKSDEVVQSAGQLAGQFGLSLAGVPWFVTSGVTTFGGEAENALNQGATHDEATGSAFVSAGAEILSEKLFGGDLFVGKSGSDLATSYLSSAISNKSLRTLAKLAGDSVGEGFEEIFSEGMSKLGSALYREEKLGEILFSEEALNDYIDSFWGGFALGGAMGTINAAQSKAAGVDYTSGLTENEQKVVDKLYQDEIASREKEGKVTQKEKSKIYDSILEDMEKGYISIDTIEEVLGGDTYSAYRNIVDSEDAILKEYDELGEKQNATPKDYARYTELTEMVRDIHKNSQRNAFREKLDEDVMGLVKGSRLAESYNERARTGQKFEADVTKYDAKQQAVVQKAIDSGILNNSNRTHEFVDFVSKISADTGVLFDFSNTAKIREAGFAVEGQTVDGYITKDGITVNIDSPKSRQFVVGHEITHALEGTELYDALRKSVFDYAKMKNQYGVRMESIQKRYKEGTDFEAELTADLVGEYIFSDTDFINNLSTQNRNVFQKVYDEIKYLCKVATAGSKEARELEKVKRAFEKAYREGGKTTEVKAENFYDSEAKYSLRVTDKDTLDALNNQETVTTYKTMQLVDGKLYPPMASRIEGKFEDYSELGAWEQATEHPELIKNGNKFKLDKGKGQGSIEAAYNPYMHSSNLVLNDQFSGAYKRNNLVTVECEVPVSELTSGYHAEFAKDSVGWHPWHTGTVAGQLRNAKGTERQVLLSRWIKPVRIVPDSEVAAMYKELLDGTNVEVPDNVVTPSLLNELKKAGVKIKESGRVKYSLSDSDGKQLTKEQQEYFKDSKMRDENGNLKVMYHGSQDAGFHVFDSKMSDDDTSFFFVDRNDVAASYSGTTETYEAKTIRTAEDMNNFLAEIGYDQYEAVEKDGKFELLEDGEHVTTKDTAQEIYEEFCWYEGVGEGDANYKVYLNLKNPLEVDAKGNNWNKIESEFSQEIYDRYQTLTAEEKEALVDLAEWEDFGLFKSEIYGSPSAKDEVSQRLKSAYYKLMDENQDIDMYQLFDIASDNFTEESLRENAVQWLKTRDYAQRAKEQGYDGVIFKNIVDVGGYGNGSEGAATVAIAFDSNQIKSVANAKPTADPDIRYSLSDSNGRELSKEQSEYFKDSKVRDENGSLLAVYHGSKSSGFNVFQYSKDVQTGTDYGEAYYFTSDRQKASGYSYDVTKDERVAQYQKDRETLKNRFLETRSKADADAFLNYRYEGKKLHELVDDEAYLTEGGEVKEVYLNLKNPLIADAGGKYYYEVYPEYFDKARKNGNDGIIVKNVIDNPRGEARPIDTYIAFRPEQIKNIDNKNPTSSSDIRYSLSEDSDGRKLSSATAKRFGNSKVVDENGSLKVVYHGTATGEFSVFDKAKGSVEGDFGSGFYFTDNESDVSEHYEGGGPDFENKVARLAERIEADEDIDYEEAEERARAELYKGSHKFEVYLNIENPAIVGKTYLFDSDFGDRYNEEDFDDYDEYIAETEQAVADAIDEIIWEVEKNVDVYSTDGLADVIYEAYYEGGIGLEELKDRINQLYLEDNEGNFVGNEVVRQIIESLGYDGIIDPTVSGKWNMDIEDGTTHYIVFKPNQIKAVTNQNPTDNPDIHRSLSNVGEQHTPDSLSALRLDAPVAEDSSVVAGNATTTPTVSEEESVRAMFPDDGAAEQEELENLQAEEAELRGVMEAYAGVGDIDAVNVLIPEHEAIRERIKELQQRETDRADSLVDAEAPPEMDAPISMKSENYNPYSGVTLDDINRSYRTYSDRNPAARQYMEEGALGFAYDVNNSTHGEKWYNDQLYYATGGEQGFGGTKRATTDDIADLKDTYGYTWDELRKAADDVIKGEVRSVAAKRVEYLIHKRLMEGYTDVDGRRYEPNQQYITFLNEQFANEQRTGDFGNLLENADQYAPAEEIALLKPASKLKDSFTGDAPIFEGRDGQTTMFEPEKKSAPTGGKTANVLTNEPKTPKRRGKFWSLVKEHVLDNGMVFEDLSKETGNRNIEAKWNFIRYSKSRAQRLIGEGADGVKALKDIKKEVDKTGKTGLFYDYLYHKHNVDRMSLEDRFDNVPNKAVFGDSVTSEISQRKVNEYELANPEFMRWADDVYGYMNHLRGLLVDNGVISQETADLWEEMYPHYVPIRRAGEDGININVPLDTYRTTVNNPVKRATGGNQDILPLFDTMAQRTIQTYKAIARNSFGIELKNQLGSVVDTGVETVDDVIDGIDTDDALLKPGMKDMNPTFTVFENGERVEFEITEEMYEAMKPTSEALQYRNKIFGTASNVFRGLTTQYSIPFMATNAIKDAQDVLINSQHPVKTYANFPRAWWQQATNGKWYQEYIENGGEDNTYFDTEENVFKEDSGLMKAVKFPLTAISTANNFIELTPRLSEYIASREAGRSIEVSMLDAARVTTNFAAGGDLTKFLNRNGATFLNASVQGAIQQVRNVREAHHKGLMGYVGLATKFALAGLPTVLLNNMLWDDDEDYEELADYVKQDYYVIGKYGDGKFIRIPKGRTVSVIQNAIEQVQHIATGDGEADLGAFLTLAVNNLAPNNPLENNIIAPIMQVAKNKTWYGEELVPSRLQDLPSAEQFDEKTDNFSKWLGEQWDISPYKVNYLLNQYSGGIGDVLLPMMTPRAESGDDSLFGNLTAPLRDKFTTDSVINSQVVSDYYDTKDALAVKANSGNATEDDFFRDLYMDTVGWELSDLYKQKREIQNSDLPDPEKYAQSRALQEQIVERMKQSLNSYDNINASGVYAEIGDKRFNKDVDSGKWYEIKPKNADGSDNWYYVQEQLSHDKLGMSYDDFWNGKEPTSANQTYYGEYNGKRYNYDAEKNQWYEIRPKNDDGTDNWYYQMEQEVTKGLGISYEEYWSKPQEYNFAYEKPGQYAVAQAVGGYDSYKEHYDVLKNSWSDNYLRADKDKYGNSIDGSRKKKVLEYINGLDMDYGERIILYRTVYSSKSDKRKYNQDIIDYLNERDDIDYQEMKSILEELDMKVDSKGRITW